MRRNEMRFSPMMLAIAVAIGIFSCGGGESEVAVEEKAIPVTISVIERSDLVVERVFTGSLEGIRQAQIFGSIPEAVVGLPVPEGSAVEAGQPVILLDKAGSYSRYDQSRAMFEEARDNFGKTEKLFEQGAVSEQAFTNAKTAYEVARANFTSARQQVELTSPISGILTDLSVNIGEFVPLGVPLATVAQNDRMRLTIYVDAQSASHLKKGQKARIFVEILGSGAPEFEGRVAEVSKSADPSTRLFKVELHIDNSDGRLRPGMFARASIAIAKLDSVLGIPAEAVFSVEGVEKVFVLRGDRARERDVKTGETTLKYAQIVSGLSEGDTVVVIGRNLLEDSSLVSIAGQGADSDSVNVSIPDTGTGSGE
jgi:membrane fusion protein (multidrug efflux system)